MSIFIETYEDYFHITIPKPLSDQELKILIESSSTVRKQYVADLLQISDEFVEILEKEFQALFPPSIVIFGEKYFFRKDVADFFHDYGEGFIQWMNAEDYPEYSEYDQRYLSQEAQLFNHFLTDTYRPYKRKLKY